MQTEYHTTRHTTVKTHRNDDATRRPIGRPRKEPGEPKSPYTHRESPKRGMFELIGDDPEFVIVDAIVPRKIGLAMKAIWDATR